MPAKIFYLVNKSNTGTYFKFSKMSKYLCEYILKIYILLLVCARKKLKYIMLKFK